MKKFRLPALFVGLMMVCVLFGCKQANGADNFSDDQQLFYDAFIDSITLVTAYNTMSESQVNYLVTENNKNGSDLGVKIVDTGSGGIAKGTTEEQLRARFKMEKI